MMGRVEVRLRRTNRVLVLMVMGRNVVVTGVSGRRCVAG